MAALGASLGLHVAGFAGVAGAWLAGGTWAGADPERERRLEQRLQVWWAKAMWRAAERLYRLRLEVDGDDCVEPGPVLVLSRHASLIDTLIPLVILSVRHGLRLRYVMKRELLWDPCIDAVGPPVADRVRPAGYRGSARDRARRPEGTLVVTDPVPRGLPRPPMLLTIRRWSVPTSAVTPRASPNGCALQPGGSGRVTANLPGAFASQPRPHVEQGLLPVVFNRKETTMESPGLESGTLMKTKAPSATQRARNGGLSPKRLARMHDVMRRHVDSRQLPGLVALISRRGMEYVDAMGTLAFDRTAPMRRDTIFRLASVTKPITAVAAMILVEDCRLRLDDPVDPWLPELANRKVLRTIDSELDDTVPAKRPITVRDLLTFRSGYGEVAFLSPTCPLQRAMFEAHLPLSAWLFAGNADELMQRLGRLPLASQPGTRWLYHMSAEILGVLIARVSGMSLSAFLRERIFEPLGMKDTGFTVPEAQLDRVATCYQTDFVTGEITVLENARADLLVRPPAFEAGAGGLVSTADDLLAFGRMMLNRGEHAKERILSRPTVELMATDQLTPEQKAASPFFGNIWDSRGWGLGMSVVTQRDDVASVPGRFGWDGAFSTSWYVDPREEMVGVLMAQVSPGALRLPSTVLDFWTSAYQAIDD